MKLYQEEGNDSIHGSINPLNGMDEALEAKEMQYKVEGINGSQRGAYYGRRAQDLWRRLAKHYTCFMVQF